MRRIGELKVWKVLWALFVLLMPLTSVPVIVRLVHSDVVAAPSALLLPPLLIISVLPFLTARVSDAHGDRHACAGCAAQDTSPHMLRSDQMSARKSFSENLSPLVLFVITALIATAVSFYYQLPDYKGADPFRASLSAVITLFIGFGFYLVSLAYHTTEEKLNTTFKLLSISGAVVCLWTLIQAFFWYRFQRYPEWMKDIQFTLSIGSLYRQRFVGFTLEPSWLAHQLNLLYLPFWFAASLTGYSAFRFRLKFITVERILFAAGVLVLFLTLSRVGLAAFLLTAGFCAVVFVHRIIRRLQQRFPARQKGLVTILAYIGIVLLFAAAAYGILRLLAKLDFRMAGIFDIRAAGRSDPVFYIAEKLSLAARFVYWDGGFSIFNAHPLLGVGLGHAGLYLPWMMNDYAYRLVEVRSLLYQSNTLLNIKSLWIRVLAETGIIGFAFFFIWYLRSLLTNVLVLNIPDRLRRTAAWMGCFALIAFILEGFSLDTFALPYIWFSTGLAAAAGELKS